MPKKRKSLGMQRALPSRSIIRYFPYFSRIENDILCHRISGLEDKPTFSHHPTKRFQRKKAEDFSSAFSGLYPPPGTLPNPNLLQRGFGAGAGADGSGTGYPHNGILNRAEGAHARAVRGLWVCRSEERRVGK